MIPPTPPGADQDTPVFVISVAAQLAGLHAQTLRSYDRLGLVSPGRSAGGGRRYSARDIAMLQEVQRLSQDHGVNLAGIKRIIELENQVDAPGWPRWPLSWSRRAPSWRRRRPWPSTPRPLCTPPTVATWSRCAPKPKQPW
jgi:DNA-binding transcriptional MerR regulator